MSAPEQRLKRTLRRLQPLAVTWLLVIGMCLRALLAPGYMLAYDRASPTGLTVVLCAGPHPIERRSGPDPQAHHTHHTHGHTDPGTTTAPPQDPFANTCGLLTVSGTFVCTPVVACGSSFTGATTGAIDYRAPFLTESHQRTQRARAPPEIHTS